MVFILKPIKQKNIMPMLDGTGPQGRGPMTGRGNGPCGRGYGQGGYGYGRGNGRGYGYGRGNGYGYEPDYGYRERMITKDEQKEILEDEMSELSKEIKAIKERISDLKTSK